MGVRWETVEIARTSVPLANTFLRCENAVGTAIVLPGGRGGWMTPSVYYPVLAMLDRSLDVLALESNYKVFPEIAILSADAAAAFDVGLETRCPWRDSGRRQVTWNFGYGWSPSR